jgi:hypothetical protein
MDKFMIMISLTDYLYLFQCIHEHGDNNDSSKEADKNVVTRSEVIQLAVNKLNKLTSALCLRHECLNVELELSASEMRRGHEVPC